MSALTPSTALVLLTILACPAALAAQPVGVLGTRAQGMAGAFVAVADDASAVYWNPAGLAGGAYFSLVLDGSQADATSDAELLGGERSAWIIALSTPALGLGYYRLQTSSAAAVPGGFRLDSLTTHHVGATLVQSLADRVAVGATVKLVRGLAGSGEVPAGSVDAALDDWDVVGQSGSRVDLDLGVAATGSFGRLGLVVRNLTEPGFDTGGGRELVLDRQVRAGASVLLLQHWTLAADVDFLRHRSALGDVRELAVGSEGQVTRRFTARGGVKINTAGDAGRTPSLSVGASFAVLGSVLVDAQATGGGDEAFRGWGVAARVLF